jgi:archaellum component FlaC
MERSYHITDNGSASQRGLENETKIRILSTEIERLNNNLHRKVDEVHLLTSEVNTLRQVNE